MTTKPTDLSTEQPNPSEPVNVNDTTPRQDTEAPSRKSSTGPVLLGAGIIVVALAVALWYQQRHFSQASATLQAAVQEASSTATQARDASRRLAQQSDQQKAAIASLESALNDSRAQVDTLVQAFQTLTDTGSDLVLLNDIDHLVTIAQQQLQLGGNVANAIVALETAQAQLARANRPGLASLLQTINGDLDRLRAVATVDVAMLVSELETLSALVSQAPLMIPDDAAPAPVARAPEFNGFSVPPTPTGTTDTQAPWWEQSLDVARDWTLSAWESVRHDLERFILVRRVDDATAMLMSPDQATRFRENLRLRIMTAQLALMMRQPTVWKTETEALVKSIESRFDERSPQSREALRLARKMQDTDIDTRLPTVTNSLKAIEALRDESARKATQANAEPADGAAEPSDSAPEPAPSANGG